MNNFNFFIFYFQSFDKEERRKEKKKIQNKNNYNARYNGLLSNKDLFTPLNYSVRDSKFLRIYQMQSLNIFYLSFFLSCQVKYIIG